MRRAPYLLSILGAVVLATPVAAPASDATLRATVRTWSARISLDARGIGLSASQRHPREMTLRAMHFRADALRARNAVALVRVTSVRARRAKTLALTAFRDYVIVGTQWILSGQARLRGQRTIAVLHARTAQRYATSGSRLLVAAGGLLR